MDGALKQNKDLVQGDLALPTDSNDNGTNGGRISKKVEEFLQREPWNYRKHFEATFGFV